MMDVFNSFSLKTIINRILVFPLSLTFFLGFIIPAFSDPELLLSEERVILDRQVSILVQGLPPGQKIIIRGEIREGENKAWRSWGKFEADREGQVRPDSMPALEGTYSGIDGMGLFWAMEVFPPEDAPWLNEWPSTVYFSLEDENGGVLDTAFIERVEFDDASIERQLIDEDGIYGAFFTPKGEGPFPLVVIFGGSRGGLIETTASILASHGYATFALAYFNYKDLPSALLDIPLEYVDRGLDWAVSRSETDPDRVFIVGVSKGAELALVYPSYFPKTLKGIVAYVPTNVVWQGLTYDRSIPPTSSWSYQGNSLPFTPFYYKPEDFAKQPFEIRIGYERARQNNLTPEGGSIPVEEIKAPILLFSGGDDRLWPSLEMSEELIKRLENNNFPFSVDHIAYPGAGHSFFTSNLPQPPFNGQGLNLGGTPKDNAFAARNAWQIMLDFLEVHSK